MLVLQRRLRRGVNKVILELDNLPLVASLQSGEEDRSIMIGLRQEIRELGRVFHDFRVSFVRREGNEAAHMCACMASALSQTLCWLDNVPDCIRGLSTRIVTR